MGELTAIQVCPRATSTSSAGVGVPRVNRTYVRDVLPTAWVLLSLRGKVKSPSSTFQQDPLSRSTNWPTLPGEIIHSTRSFMRR